MEEHEKNKRDAEVAAELRNIGHGSDSIEVFVPNLGLHVLTPRRAIKLLTAFRKNIEEEVLLAQLDMKVKELKESMSPLRLRTELSRLSMLCGKEY